MVHSHRKPVHLWKSVVHRKFILLGPEKLENRKSAQVQKVGIAVGQTGNERKKIPKTGERYAELMGWDTPPRAGLAKVVAAQKGCVTRDAPKTFRSRRLVRLSTQTGARMERAGAAGPKRGPVFACPRLSTRCPGGVQEE